MPPPPPPTSFTFTAASTPGWSTPVGSGTYAWTRRSGGTPSSSTGPTTGVGGSGYYYFCETSSPRQLGHVRAPSGPWPSRPLTEHGPPSPRNPNARQVFTLFYDGSACTATGHVISGVTFQVHMYGATMGSLEVRDAVGNARWSRNGNQGNSWQAQSVTGFASPSLLFRYVRGSSYTGDAAIAQVGVC